MIQLVPGPFLFPQRCFFTGDNTPNREVIDTGVQDTEGGRVYISLQFMDDLARAAGYATRAETEALRTENAALKAQVERIPAVTEKVADVIRSAAAAAVLDLLAGDSGDGDGGDPVPAVSQPVVGKAGKPAQGGAAAAVEQGRPRL